MHYRRTHTMKPSLLSCPASAILLANVLGLTCQSGVEEVAQAAATSKDDSAGRDWPCYQMDNQRSGYTPEVIRAPLAPDWAHRLANPPQRAWVGPGTRMRWDASFAPVIAEGRVFFGSSADGRICARDVESGQTVWTFFTGGPVRFAPYISNGRLYAVSDDGCLYCLSARDGSVTWKFRGGPQQSMVLGNDRLISRWPVRGAPIVSEGVVYFGCGIWPTDGIYVHAIDAKTGKSIWCNDTSGNTYMAQPHSGATAFSGIAAQGYFAELGEYLLVPTGRAVPAFLDKKDGTLIDFLLARNQKSGGGRLSVMPDLNAFWSGGSLFFAPGDGSGQTGGDEHAVTPDGVVYADVGGGTDGKLRRSTYREESRTDRHGKPTRLLTMDSDETIAEMSGEPTAFIVAGKHVVAGFPGKIVVCDLDGQEPDREYAVNGTVYGLAYAHGRLVASTDRGEIFCFLSGGDKQEFRQAGDTIASAADNPLPVGEQPARRPVAGYTLMLGGDGVEVIEGFLSNGRHVIVIDERAQTIDALRKHFDTRGLYGTHITALVANTKQTPLPNRFANLVVDNGADTPRDEVQRLLIPRTGRFQSSPSAMPVELDAELAGEGSWTHQHHDPANTLYSEDTVVKGPLATRWYKDLDLVMPNREGRGASPLYLDGRMYVEGIDALLCVDAYSGSELWRLSLPGIQKHMDQSHYSGSWTGGNMCLDNDHLYLVREDHCLKIDPVTGTVQGELAVPQPGKAWGYLAVKNGVLYGSIPDTDFHVRWLWRQSDMEAVYTESHSLFAMDPESGEVLWQYDAKDSIRHNTIAITGKQVFLIDRPIAEFDSAAYQKGGSKSGQTAPKEHPHGTLVALDAATGKRLWANQDDIYGTTLAASESQGVLVTGYAKIQFTLPSEFGGRLTAYRISDGGVLWDQKGVRGERSRFIIRDRDVILEPDAYDSTTGTRIDGFELERAYGCGPAVASRHLILFRSGTLGYCGAAGDKPVQSFGGIRPGCWINAIPVGGMVLMPDASEGCLCSYLNKATVALEERVAEPIVASTAAEGGLSVSIQGPEQCELRYTLDGTPPMIESPSPPPVVLLKPGTTLKIKAFKHGMPPSETVVVSNGFEGSQASCVTISPSVRRAGWE